MQFCVGREVSLVLAALQLMMARVAQMTMMKRRQMLTIMRNLVLLTATRSSTSSSSWHHCTA